MMRPDDRIGAADLRQLQDILQAIRIAHGEAGIVRDTMLHDRPSAMESARRTVSATARAMTSLEALIERTG